MIRDLINQKKISNDPNYCVRVTAHDGKLGEQYLRTFQDNEKNIPTILTTSRKLSTGVDARNVRNIVLLRPVNSMIEFKQIIGRGTRLFDHKDYFTIYDFVRAYENFKKELLKILNKQPSGVLKENLLVPQNSLPDSLVTFLNYSPMKMNYAPFGVVLIPVNHY